MPSVSCGISDGHAAGCRRHDLHGMPRGAVHQHIDHGLCGLSERDASERECGRVRGVCGGAVRSRHGGSGGVRSEQCGITVRGVSGGACAGVGRADAVRGVRRGLGDGHAEHDGRRALHGVCGGAVQCGVDGGVLGVWGGIGDGGVEQDGGDIVHGVWRGSVQQCVDCSVHIVRSWLLSG
jgi:hypothetical protein